MRSSHSLTPPDRPDWSDTNSTLAGKSDATILEHGETLERRLEPIQDDARSWTGKSD
jgi:hypothetical protein